MQIQTYSGELRASGSYASYLAHDYDDDPDLRRQIERAHRRRLDGHLSRKLQQFDLPDYLMDAVQAIKAITVVGAIEERTTIESPLVVAGPWPRGGQTRDDADRWAALVWCDLGAKSPDTPPDFCIVLDYALGPAAFADDIWCGVADIRGQGWVTCKRNGSHRWQYPGAAPYGGYQACCGPDGAMCPDCGGPLAVSLCYGRNFCESADVPWSGAAAGPRS